MRKFILAAVAVLVFLGIGVWLYADTVAKDIVESGSTRAFGTATDVDMVTLGFLDGSIGLRGYRVNGAEGFNDGELFGVDDARLLVGYDGIGSKRIEADELTIQGVRLNLVMRGANSNFGPVLQHLRGMSGGGGDSKGPRFVIRRVRIEDVGVNLDLPGIKRGLELPPIELTDVGGEDGVWMSELAGIIVGAVMKQAAKQGELPPAVGSVLAGGLDGLPAAVSGALKQRLRERVDEEAKGLLDRARDALQDGSEEGKDGG